MLDVDDYIKYRTIIKNGMQLDRALSIDALAFLGDMQDKFNRWQRQTFVSDRQAAYFERIEREAKEELGDAWEQWEEGDE